MLLRNTTERWGTITKFFHWTIALLIIVMLCVGFYMASLPNTMMEQKMFLYRNHKSIGFVVAVLMLLRLVWRWSWPVPVLPTDMRRWQKIAARLVHDLLYLLAIVMPLSGLAMSWTAPNVPPVQIFGLFTLPNPLPASKYLAGIFRQAHGLIAYSIIALVVLHVAAGLWHHFIHKDNVLRRMLPGQGGNVVH